MPSDASTSSLLRSLVDDLHARRAQIRLGGGRVSRPANHASPATSRVDTVGGASSTMSLVKDRIGPGIGAR